MEHGGGTNASAEMLGVRCNGQQRLGCGAEQQVVHYRFVVVSDRGDRGRQCEDHVEVADRQQIGLAAASQSRAAAPWHLGQ